MTLTEYKIKVGQYGLERGVPYPNTNNSPLSLQVVALTHNAQKLRPVSCR